MARASVHRLATAKAPGRGPGRSLAPPPPTSRRQHRMRGTQTGLPLRYHANNCAAVTYESSEAAALSPSRRSGRESSLTFWQDSMMWFICRQDTSLWRTGAATICPAGQPQRFKPKHCLYTDGSAGFDGPERLRRRWTSAHSAPVAVRLSLCPDVLANQEGDASCDPERISQARSLI